MDIKFSTLPEAAGQTMRLRFSDGFTQASQAGVDYSAPLEIIRYSGMEDGVCILTLFKKSVTAWSGRGMRATYPAFYALLRTNGVKNERGECECKVLHAEYATHATRKKYLKMHEDEVARANRT